MYDIDTKNVRKGNKLYFMFLAAGLLFLIVFGGFVLVNTLKLKNLDATTMSNKVEIESSTDDDGATLYSPTYYYRVNGEKYVCESNVSSSSNPGTSNKIVYYDSKNPSNCMTEYSKSSNKFFALFLILPLILILVSIINIRKIGKRVKLINELNQKGKLVKNLQYHLENTGMSINNVQIQRPVVEYTFPSGVVVTLYGDPRHDGKLCDDDGMVDLVIDEENPDNYFIDFEINRLSGNLPTDYYNYNTKKDKINDSDSISTDSQAF